MAPSQVTTDSTILIIGAGTWGCSTALHLARRGYKHITVLDPYAVPSPIAAGNDINKISEHSGAEDWPDPDKDPQGYADHVCRENAIMAWKNDPVFKPYYHETGFIVAAHTPSTIEHVKKHELYPSESVFEKLETAEDFRKTMPEGVLTGSFPGWKGWWKKDGAGWVHARKALVSAYEEAKRLGVNFITGSPQGNVIGLKYENGDVIGAETADSQIHRANHTILAAGAGSDRLLDFKKQLRPTAWTLSHIRMSPQEAKLYRNLPVLFNVAKGFFMEPDEDKHELKICDEHPGYCNWVADPNHPGEKISLPFAKHQIPLEAEARARDFLRDTMPHLAERPFAFARICWDADTPDRCYLIDRHPDHPSLLLACGASGHGFMQMPAIGGFVADALEGKLHRTIQYAYRWRPETAVNRDWKDTQDRYGGPNRMMDFQDIGDNEWTTIYGHTERTSM
ncbi:hypothetical protein DTO063F5_6006 [Paecilomyces variotii]|nr:hypothetical protein DTO063F5_6006 [Paecilomyces variotii]